MYKPCCLWDPIYSIFLIIRNYYSFIVLILLQIKKKKKNIKNAQP